MNASLVPLIRTSGIAHGIMLSIVLLALFFAFSWLVGIGGNWTLTLPDILTFIFIITFTYAAFIYVVSIYVVFIYSAHSDIKRMNNGAMTFGQGVGISFWIGLASGTYTSIITIFFVVLEEASVNMREIFDLRKMLFLFIVIFGSIIFAVIVGLVVSLFTKKNPDAATF